MDRPREAGRCDTTMTMRFAVDDCSCNTYEDNLGPCAWFSEGINGRCVYCDHDNVCHKAVEVKSEQCDHYWIPSAFTTDGNPIFRVNPQLSAEPILHAKCDLCNDRTWFTEAQWNAIPAARRLSREGQ